MTDSVGWIFVLYFYLFFSHPQQLRLVLILLLMSLPTAATSSAWSPRSPKEACTSSRLDTRYNFSEEIIPHNLKTYFVLCLLSYYPACSWDGKITRRALSFCFARPLFHSSVKLVVFSVFYGFDLISHWSPAYNSQFTAFAAVKLCCCIL